MSEGDVLTRYEHLRRQGERAVQEGRLEEALGCLEEALELAEGHGDRRLIHLAFCERSAVALELRRETGIKRQLGQILLLNCEPEINHRAAYNLARAHDLAKDFSKALFYARIAYKNAKESSPERLALSHNQIGNLLVAESRFAEATEHFEKALALLPPTPSLRRALALDNVGYCYVIQGRRKRGFRALFQSLRMLGRLGATSFEAGPRGSLSFAYIEVGKYRAAIRHGARALAIAEQAGNQEWVKNCLFLLGEAAKLQGEQFAAYDYFTRLQETYYPEAPQLPQMLLFLDVRKMINLKG